MRTLAAFAIALSCCPPAQSQVFTLQTVSDSLSYLVLTTDSTTDRWPLPYPVYQFCVGDINSDGTTDAFVGVVKKTRFHQQPARRLFIFKNHHGLIRPLWMGSKLGAQLVDFRFIQPQQGTPPRIRALETGNNRQYTITDYTYEEFGLVFDRFICRNINQQDKAYEKFHSDNPDLPDDTCR